MISLLSSILLFFYIASPVADMREHPRKESEVVSQGYYSEEVNLLAEESDWLHIETKADNYKGWVPKGAIIERETGFLADPSAISVKVKNRMAHIYHVQDTIYGPILTLPFDSRLQAVEPLEESNSRWIKVALVDGQEAFIQRGDVSFEHTLLNKEQLLAFSRLFLGLPYTWGGRSSFGYDCSGYVQMLLRQMGIALPRDTKDQIKWEGFAEVSIDDLVPGDFIYFGLAQDKIRHVGLYLGQDNFIHAGVAENTPYIRVAQLTSPDWNGSGRFVYRSGRRLKQI